LGSSTFRYHGVMELSDLIYKDILSIDIVVLLDLSWKYIDYKKVIIDDVR
jgi:hypothetical protein